jgi:NAD(P)-dependent dehydrogenase (short-subunit alcohol dehydrogenase family)
MAPRFDGKSVVVTGAGTGIGRAIAVAFGAEGARVAIAARTEARLQETADLVRKAGGTALVVRTDVGFAAEVEHLVQSAVGEFGGIDVFVNNAGIVRTGPIVEVSEEDWDLVLRTNLKSIFLCSKAAARQMIAQGRGGRIINVSSIHAVLSEPNCGPYTASKGGMEAFSRTLATELAPHKITVNCIRPGATWSALTEPLYTPEILAALAQRIPLKEVAQPEWIAAGVLYFASDAARYSTGTTLDIDGGYIMDGSLPGTKYE